MSSDLIDENFDRLIRLPELENITGLRKTTLYRLIKEGSFPAGLLIGRSRLWKLSSIQEWIRQL